MQMKDVEKFVHEQIDAMAKMAIKNNLVMTKFLDSAEINT